MSKIGLLYDIRPLQGGQAVGAWPAQHPAPAGVQVTRGVQGLPRLKVCSMAMPTVQEALQPPPQLPTLAIVNGTCFSQTGAVAALVYATLLGGSWTNGLYIVRVLSALTKQCFAAVGIICHIASLQSIAVHALYRHLVHLAVMLG